MNVQQRVNAFKGLAGFLHDFLNNSSNPLSSKFPELDKVIHESYLYNGWFTNENIHKALSGFAAMLSNESLDQVGKLVKDGPFRVSLKCFLPWSARAFLC